LSQNSTVWFSDRSIWNLQLSDFA